MASLREAQILGLASLAVGIALSFFSNRVPRRGWIGVVMLLLASLFWALIDRDGNSQASGLPMFAAFLFVSPIAVVYSFRVRRAAPDRMFALAAFAGSFLVAAFLLFMLFGIIYSFFVV